MKTQQEIDYDRIATAIQYLRHNYKNQPKLDEVADYVNLSPFHFQRMFQNWAGVTPKQFLQYLSIEHAKKALKDTQSTIFNAALETGLSGTGRLHDLFVNIEGMTPGEFKNGGKNLTIHFSFANTPFGKILVAATPQGVCHLAFVDQSEDIAFNDLQSQFAHARFSEEFDNLQQNALAVFNLDWNQPERIKLHLKGTGFQLKVWEALLKIPAAGLTTYAELATRSGHGKAFRAVGTAVGKNPVAFLIPCHRVIKSTGEIGNYHWGEARKSAMIGWEASKCL